MNEHINSSVNVILTNLENWLNSFGPDQKLPSSIEVKKYLQNEATIILSDIYNEVNFALDNLYTETNDWVKTKLRQTEMEIDKYSDPNFNFVSNFAHLISPISRHFVENRSTAVNMLQEGLIFLGDLATGIYQMLEQLFIGKDEVRRKQVRKTLEKSRISYTNVFQNSKGLYTNYVSNQYTKILTQINDRTKVYLGNIDAQLNKLDHELADGERKNFERFLEARKKFALEAERIIIQFNQNIKIVRHD